MQLMELDEMHVYIGPKKLLLDMNAVDRHGKRFLNCLLNTRGVITGERLWNSIEDLVKGHVMTDYW